MWFFWEIYKAQMNQSYREKTTVKFKKWDIGHSWFPYNLAESGKIIFYYLDHINEAI